MNWIDIVGFFTKIVLIFLMGLSLWSVSIIVDRRRVFRAMDDAQLDAQFRRFLEQGDLSGLKKLLKAGGLRSRALELFLSSTNPVQIEHLARAFVLESKNSLDQGLTTLATLGANAPFIGLFGTVLGIIQAFGALSNNPDGNMNLVMFLIAEALISTAVGLVVAIPAVVFFNRLQRQLRACLNDCESLKERYLSWLTIAAKS